MSSVERDRVTIVFWRWRRRRCWSRLLPNRRRVGYVARLILAQPRQVRA
jgi:hypothetical protein